MTVESHNELVKKYNPKGLITLWYRQIYARYKKQIDDEDFTFSKRKGPMINVKKTSKPSNEI